MALNTSNEKLGELFSLALEDRSSGYQDLVSNSNVLLATMQEKGMWQSFEGPTIRERLLYAESGTYTRYSGYQFLNPKPADLISDAEFTPKLAAVSVVVSGEEILANSGSTAQLLDVFDVHLQAAEQELKDRFNEDLHSDGTADAGRQIGGLQLALPTAPSAGTYGGIARSNAIWQTSAYDANSFFSGFTGITSTSVKSIFNQIAILRSRGKKGPEIVLSAQEHYLAYSAATEAIQRINDNNGVGKLGFPSLKFFGGGRSMDIVLEGGIGSAMPSNVSYFVDTDALKFRFHKKRNFSKIGGKQMPINQDAVVQHIGFMGELTMCNPLHMAKLYDSVP